MLKDFYVFLLILTILKFYICTLIYNYEKNNLYNGDIIDFLFF